MVSNILVLPDAKRDAAAVILAASAHTWPIVTLKKAHGAFPVGTCFLAAPSSDGRRYLCNTVVCECVDYKRGHVCKHIRAAIIVDQRERTPLGGRKELPLMCFEGGCQDEPEPGESFCWRHALVDAF